MEGIFSAEVLRAYGTLFYRQEKSFRNIGANAHGEAVQSASLRVAPGPHPRPASTARHPLAAVLQPVTIRFTRDD
jgi:hypothetical protein